MQFYTNHPRGNWLVTVKSKVITRDVEETIVNKLNTFSVVNIRFIVHYMCSFAKILKLKWNLNCSLDHRHFRLGDALKDSNHEPTCI